MGRIIVPNYVTLDGFLAGPNGEIDWFVWDEETAQYSKNLLNSTDTIDSLPIVNGQCYKAMSSHPGDKAHEHLDISKSVNQKEEKNDVISNEYKARNSCLGCAVAACGLCR
jgi:hypothetical protein